MTAPRKDESVPTVPVTPVAPVVPVVPVVPMAPQTEVEPRRKLWQALFFTKDGRLDLGWLLLAISFGVFLIIFSLMAAQVVPADAIPKEAWVVFGAVITMAFIGGAARDRAALIAKSTVVGSVAQAVSSAQAIAQRRAEGGDFEPSP